MPGNKKSGYTPTEAKYKGGAQEMYVTYDLKQETRGGNTATYPKVKRVYVAGDVTDWDVGEFKKKSGRKAFGVKVAYEQRREGYRRRGYTAHRNGKKVEVPATEVAPSVSSFKKVVEVPEDATNIKFRGDKLPKRYESAAQSVR